jgi:uncharacterized iron-regulated membrane protein
MKLRTLIFWPHLIAGVVAGVIVLIMSVTGVLLTYERQLIAMSDSHLRSTPPGQTSERLPIETLVESLRFQRPDLQPTAVTVGSGSDATAVFTVGQQRTVHLDVYSGAVLGDGTRGTREFMSDLRAWHRWLAVEGEGRPLARAITGWANVLFAFIVLTGIYLWFPRKWTWQHLKPTFLFRSGLAGKARDFNWHNVIGVWSAIPLFIVVASAVPISFPWASDAVYRATGEEPPARAGRGGGGGQAAGRQGGGREGGAEGGDRREGGRERGEPAEAPSLDGLNDLWAKAETRVDGWRTINMRLPNNAKAPVVFAIDRGDGGQPHLRSTLTLDRASGAEVSYEDFSSQTPGRQARSIMRFAHTGEVLGIPGQTVAGLVSAGGVVLVYTGIALTLRRFVAWIRRRRVRAPEREARDAAA